MTDPTRDGAETCPKCSHRWAAHHGRRWSQRCAYRPYAGYSCPCDLVNPAIAAEALAAAAEWNSYLGRTTSYAGLGASR